MFSRAGSVVDHAEARVGRFANLIFLLHALPITLMTC